MSDDGLIASGNIDLADAEIDVLTPEELASLVGGPVDPERGDGYVPPSRPDEPCQRYTTAAVVLSVRVKVFEAGGSGIR